MQVRSQKSLAFAVFTAGFTSVTVQILFMRECFTLFYGNELSLGVLFGVWLFWTGMGSGPLAKRLMHGEDPSRRFSRIQLSLAALIPLTFLLLRASRLFLGITPGERVGLFPMFGIVFAILPAVCLPSGLLYTLACGLFRSSGKPDASAISNVYRLEAIGSAVGGLVSSLALIPLLKSVELIFILSALNWFSSALIHHRIPLENQKIRLRIIAPMIVLSMLVGFGLSGFFQKKFDGFLWKGYDLLESRNTPYGVLSVVRLENQISFFENGIPLFTVPDPQTAEESVHFTMIEHPAPENVLLIGGGPAGTIREILKHPTVRSVDYVELDPEIITTAKKFLPPEEIRWISDPRVRVFRTDGRRFVKSASGRYDAILVLLPNPCTAQLNRFYTQEFFAEADRILRPGGVFSIQVPSSENAVGPELGDYLGAIRATMAEVFPDLVILPGETARFIACNRKGILTSEPEEWIARIRSRKIGARYVREYYLRYQLSKERQNALMSGLRPVPDSGINSDFKPAGYRLDAMLWASGFSAWIKPVYRFFSGLRIGVLNVALLTLSILFGLLNGRSPSARIRAVVLSISAAGFTQIAIEWILILACQIVCGAAYRQMALIIAGFMCGLSMGSASIRFIRGGWKADRTFYSWMPVMTAAYILFLTKAAFPLLSQNILPLSLSGLAFILLACLAGCLAGFQFALANRIIVQQKLTVQKTAGMLYGTDLFGSCFGAIFISAFLVPVFGVRSVLGLLMWINLAAWIVLFPGKPTRFS